MTEREAWTKDNVKRHRSKMAIHKSRRDAWDRVFPHSLQKGTDSPGGILT